MKRLIWLLLILIGGISPAIAQRIVVNEAGVMIDSQTGEEQNFFGVNYSTPFAHSYRAIKELGLNHKQVIDEDVYHFARLNFNGFRIHVWDTEISDSLGNLLTNEHLDLFDYMIWKLQERNISIIITPLTFYDNAYPDGATETPGFANYISKEQAPLNKEFYPVIKNYLEQFLNHKNPYTGKTYVDDPMIIATEIINEPTHYGNENAITAFVNEMAEHVRSVGWEKPVFYNVAQNPDVADAVLKAEVDGLSFQWYPAGLVGGETMVKNYAPHVNDYPISFSNRAGFSGKALMVYEFDAADTKNAYAYPMMARSFREAGFQWASQFAYDPTAIAPYNSDYPTHYLNLLYSPKRALSMMIAGEIFRSVPRNTTFSSYLTDTTFFDATLGVLSDRSIFNDGEKFIYSGSNDHNPKDPEAITQIAGRGSSVLITYEGTGAYFMDKVRDGVWRLEVNADVIELSDPFEKPNFKKQINRLEKNAHAISIHLPDLSEKFWVRSLIKDRTPIKADKGSFIITPGVYVISNKKMPVDLPKSIGNGKLGFSEFYDRDGHKVELPEVVHHPQNNWIEGKDHVLKANIQLPKKDMPVQVVLAPYGKRGRDIQMTEVTPGKFEAVIPGDFLEQGKITYWITVGDRGNQITFPGSYKGYPWDWNYYHDEFWSADVLAEHTPVVLFDADKDFRKVDFSFAAWQGEYERRIKKSDSDAETELLIFGDSLKQSEKSALGFSVETTGIIPSGLTNTFSSMIVSADSYTKEEQDLTIVLIDKFGLPYSQEIRITKGKKAYELSLSDFKADRMVLLPRPYPVFLPFWFENETDLKLDVNSVQEIQFLLLPNDDQNIIGEANGFSVSKVILR